MHQSKIYSTDKELLLSILNTGIEENKHYLKNANLLIITLGSSFYYLHNDLKFPVANCHKVNAQNFTRMETNIDTIYEAYSDLILAFRNVNPNLKILFTVSPVRYLKDGFIENSRSKAKLIVAIEKLQMEFSSVYYFPSYEIFIDDLRDYRFVKEDLVHPNDLAIDYIWNMFNDFYFDQITVNTIVELKRIKLLQAHISIHPESNESKVMIDKIRILEEAFTKKYPEVKL